MLKIQVNGRGLIPRGFGLAPRKDPFPADLTLIQTIMSTPGLSIKYVNPDDGRLLDLTRNNLMRVWNKCRGRTYEATKEQPVLRPSVPEETKKDPEPVQVSEPVVPVVEETAEPTPEPEPAPQASTFSLKPVNAPGSEEPEKKETASASIPMTPVNNPSNQYNKNGKNKHGK